MFERFTDRARRVLVLAQEEARLLNHNFIGTEHILLGLIHDGEGVAAKVLESSGVSLEAARQQVGETIGPAGAHEPAGSPPFTPRAKKVLELSLREALQLGHNYIGTEHILLGLIREGEGVGPQVLITLTGDLPGLRERVVRRLTPHEQPLRPGPPMAARPAPTPAPSETPPDCPNCGASLAEHARHRLLEVPAATEGGEPRPFVVVYCERCGRALAFKPND